MLLDVDKLATDWTPVEFSGLQADPEITEVISLSGPVELRAEVRKKEQRVQLRGEFSTRGTVECSRCLEPAEISLAAPFEVIYAAPMDDEESHDLEVAGENLSVAELTGDTIDLKDFAREQVLLNVPARVLCRDDCQGLCAICGANKNLSPCGCEAETIDPRWQALKGIVK